MKTKTEKDSMPAFIKRMAITLVRACESKEDRDRLRTLAEDDGIVTLAFEIDTALDRTSWK